MSGRFYPVLEQPVAGFERDTIPGKALARVVEAHPTLAALTDFVSVDPVQIALAVGMVYPYEEDGAEDLNDLVFDPPEWYEPALGLAVVRRALSAVRDEPGSIAAAIYDPGLHPEDVITDLEAIEQALLQAQQHETRFHFAMDADSAPSGPPRI